jgi:hypothetical protein
MRLVSTGRRSKPRPEKGSMPCFRDGFDPCAKDVGFFDTLSDFSMVVPMHEKKVRVQEYP